MSGAQAASLPVFVQSIEHGFGGVKINLNLASAHPHLRSAGCRAGWLSALQSLNFLLYLRHLLFKDHQRDLITFCQLLN